MRIRWYGQSSFLLTDDHRVFIDPFGVMNRLSAQGLQFDYPPIEGVEADVLLVTHEHGDHNAVDVIGGSPLTLRSTAGTLDSPLGAVTAVASAHDDVAGTKRGPNTIFVFTLDGLRVAHFGDFGQAELRAEQANAIGDVDILILPVGGGPTVGGEPAAAIVRRLRPRLVIPMHYRTDAVNFLDPPDAFLAALGLPVTEAGSSEIEIDASTGGVVLFATP